MSRSERTPRQIADAYVADLVELQPELATALGYREHDHRMPDFSAAGRAAVADTSRAALAELRTFLDRTDEPLDPVERRCARLLSERLNASLALHDTGEDLRAMNNLNSPVQTVRSIFLTTPAETISDWTVIARRLAAVPDAVRGYQDSLREGASQDLYAGPSQVTAVVAQLRSWVGANHGESWYHEFVAAGPAEVADALAEAADQAATALDGLRAWLERDYAPGAANTADTVGEERYARFARQSTGSDLNLAEAYTWGLEEVRRIEAEMRSEVERVLPGASAMQAMAHLSEHGDAVHGEDAIRQWLQQLMDEVIAAFDGTHVDLAPPVRVVEARIAPPGGAAAPYYTRPSLDFSRPGRTWLPTMGETRFPLWNLVSTWYHEGVPGHHLQLAQWTYLSDQLSVYQAGVGSVSATTEGWALYAERLMDELGWLDSPGARMGYLDAQLMRAVRVVVDIGMHLGLEVPADIAAELGVAGHSTWTPKLARRYFGNRSGRTAEFLDSELVRYLGVPGQAISYKLGERAWLSGRAAAEATHGDQFDLKAWHMGALSLGALGLDDLVEELTALPADR